MLIKRRIVPELSRSRRPTASGSSLQIPNPRSPRVVDQVAFELRSVARRAPSTNVRFNGFAISMKDVWHDPPLFPFKLGRAVVLFLEQGSEGLQYRERDLTTSRFFPGDVRPVLLALLLPDLRIGAETRRALSGARHELFPYLFFV